MPDEELDLKGLSCPMPIVKISKAVKRLGAGSTLKVHASDPAFRADLEAWTRKTGHRLLEFEDGDVQTALIQKAS